MTHVRTRDYTVCWAKLFRIVWNTSITLFPLRDFTDALNILLQVWAVHYPSLNSINQLTLLAHAYEWLLKVTLKLCKKDIGHIFQHKYQLKINIFKLFSIKIDHNPNFATNHFACFRPYVGQPDNHGSQLVGQEVHKF